MDEMSSMAMDGVGSSYLLLQRVPRKLNDLQAEVQPNVGDWGL